MVEKEKKVLTSLQSLLPNSIQNSDPPIFCNILNSSANHEFDRIQNLKQSYLRLYEEKSLNKFIWANYVLLGI